jgi:hypothetical protein
MLEPSASGGLEVLVRLRRSDVAPSPSPSGDDADGDRELQLSAASGT